jgi:cytochrome oxidase Cu insertion factor (SCO1/SenC/PrrC family)
MPGMNSGVNLNDPVVIAAFKALLLHQGLLALLIFATLGLVWVSIRALSPARPTEGTGADPAGAPEVVLAEPRWRQVLRIGFGVLWVFDGILQAQPKMAIGLPSQVIEPIAANSPRWVQQIVNWAGTTWSYHPLQAGAAAVWIQLGIGIWMLAAARGPASRIAALASAGWGLVVWVFGESFGGIFAPGLTWMFGAPGAVLIYAMAGVLIALPEQAWRNRRLGELMLAGIGAFLVGMAVLQAWPGRGFWQGEAHGRPGTLAAMTASMAPTLQPHLLSAWVTAFTGFDEAHGFAVNLFVVAALAAAGLAFATGRPRLIRPVLIGFIVLCLADWVLVEDFGFLGGLGTDPNSMIPLILLAAAGYLALVQSPAVIADPAEAAAAAQRWRDRLRLRLAGLPSPGEMPRLIGSASIRSVASLGAIAIVLLGAVPMAAAQASPVADTILAQAIAGSAAPANFPAPPFTLTDQNGRPVTLASLRGKVVLLTFLDPVCTVDCALEAQEFRQAGQLLGGADRHVELVAIVANPVDYQISYTRAFDQQERLSAVRNWLYLTGTLPQLRKAWTDYGISALVGPAGSMIGHSELAFVIDQRGHVRLQMNFTPGPGTTATQSSFAAELAGAARQLLGRP